MEIFAHWSFVAATTILVVLSRFASKRLFTRARARAPYEKTWRGRLEHWFWHWGREYLDIFPLLLGALLGIFWRDPLAQGWKLHEDIAYFVAAGAAAALGGRTIIGAQKLKDEPT